MSDAAGRALSTGFPSLDVLLSGGIQRGDLIALGGDAGSGKSSLALAIAARVARAGGRVVYYSGEMQPARLRDRLTAMEQRVALTALRTSAAASPPPETTGQIPWVPVAEPEIKAALPGAGLQPLLDELRSLPAHDLVVVDSLQVLATNSSALDEELAAAVRRLKAAALDLSTAVLLVAHCDVDRARSPVLRPALGDFGASGAVKQHSDAVLALFREEMYESVRGIEGATELHVLKNRHGNTGYVDLYFYKEWLRFEDMIEP